MKIFGHFSRVAPGAPLPSLEGLGHQAHSSYGIKGALVANSNFLACLVEYGTYDEYHFYFPDSFLSSEAEMAARLFGRASRDPRIKLKGYREITSTASQYPYFVLHRPEGPQCADTMYFRNLLLRRNVPITAVTHSISYRTLLPDIAMLLLIGMQPWDSIVCTSACGRTAFEKLMTHVAQRLLEERGIPTANPARLDTIPLGVSTDVYRPRDKAPTRQLLGLPENDIIFLWFGRFSAGDKADLQPLLIAFKRACAHLGDRKVALVLAGEDTLHGYTGTLEKFAAELGIGERVLVRKNPSVAAGPLYYSAADVFVCPADNLQETFGQVITEAMASGLPVICSDWNGFRDTVEHGKEGFRISTYWARCDSRLCDTAPLSPYIVDHLYLGQSVCVDVDEMAGAIRTLAENEHLRVDMGTAGRKRAVSMFDWSVVIRRYEELWETLHEIAERAPLRSQPAGGWLRPAYFSHFQGYASRALGLATRLSSANDVGKMPDLYRSFDPSRGGGGVGPLSSKLANSLLQLASGGATLGHLQSEGAKMGVEPEDINWCVLHLLKYGYLQVSRETPPVFQRTTNEC